MGFKGEICPFFSCRTNRAVLKWDKGTAIVSHQWARMESNMAYFPLYVDINYQKCLVVGGGNVALRKIKTLLDFGATVVVVADEICKEIIEYKEIINNKETIKNNIDERIIIKNRKYEPADCDGMELVVAATDNRELNHEIANMCKFKRIPVNSVTGKEDSTFIFAAYVKEKDVVAAFSCGGNSPYITQKLKKECQKSLTPFVGELNDLLGSIRELVKTSVDEEETKKRIYRQITELALSEERLPSEAEIVELIGRNTLL